LIWQPFSLHGDVQHCHAVGIESSSSSSSSSKETATTVGVS